MGTYTAHYNIYKPGDSETGYMTAFNTGMDNISTNIYDNATTISSHTSTLSSHTSSINTLNTFKSTLDAINGIVSCNGSGTFSAASGLIKNCVISNGTSATQSITGTSYIDLIGSSVTYTPPAGSTSVFYMFRAHVITSASYSGYGSVKLIKNGSDVTDSKQDIGMGIASTNEVILMYIFPAWSGAQVVKAQARAFSTSTPFYLNTTYSVDGVVSNSAVYNQRLIFSI